MVLNQAELFLIFVVDGIIIGFIFDIFRILRKSFKTSDPITILEDILFWLIAGIIMLYTIFIFNNGEIRLFMFIGIFLGLLLYMIILSHFIIKISVEIITVLKKIISFIWKILIFPIKSISKILKNILKKPILFLFINIRKIFRQIFSKIYKNSIKKVKKQGKNTIKVE